MFQRGLGTRDIQEAIASGEIIADYPDDLPFPSYLMLGWVNNSPIHVVAAVDADNQRCYVVTAYLPDPVQWSVDFKTRRMP
jgi:hypothetical protein